MTARIAYNKIATAYRDSKQLPFLKHMETHTLAKIAALFHGLRVWELACGKVFYARRIKDQRTAISYNSSC